MALSAETPAALAQVISSQDQSRSREVLIRTLSALTLAGVLIACLYGGWPFFHLLVFVAAGIMAWEWSHLCGRGSVAPGGHALLAACLAIVVLASFAMNGEASLVFLAALPVVALMSKHDRTGDALWLGAGVIYVGGSSWSAVALFDLYEHGVWIVVWVFLVVALTDIGAFLSGRAIGGPKLAPRISPKKTWAGLVGGLACAGLAGLVFALLTNGDAAAFHVAAALFVSFVAQAGDLFESLLKRRFNAKDSGVLIPGHGGLLDRVDGIAAAMIVVALIAWIRGGLSPPWF